MKVLALSICRAALRMSGAFMFIHYYFSILFSSLFSVYRQTITVTVMLAVSTLVVGQQHIGMSASNFSELNTLYFNPASIAAPRHSLQINIASVHNLIANNYYSIQSLPALRDYIENGGQDFNDILLTADRKPRRRADFMAEVRLPGIMVRIGKNTGIALTSRVRGIANVDGLDTRMLSELQDDFDAGNAQLLDPEFRNSGFRGQGQVFSELALSSGVVLVDTDRHRLSGGVTVKWLNGIAMASMKMRRLDVDFYDRGSGLQPGMMFSNTNVQLAWSVPESGNFSPRKILSSNIGAGVDLGVSYERRPVHREMDDEDGNDFLNEVRDHYSWKLGLSITDIGGIWYNEGTESYSVRSREVVNWTPGELSSLDNNGLGDMLDIKYGSAVIRRDRQRRPLPTTVNLQGDVRIGQFVYTSATLVARFLNGDNPSYFRAMAAIAPRLETGMFEAAFPVSYHFGYNQVNMGMAMRAGFLVVGSDDLTGLMQLRTINSSHFYAGILLNFFPRKHRRMGGPIGSCFSF